MTTFEVMSSLGVHLSRHPFVLTVGIAILLRIAIRRGILRTVARRLMLYGCAAAAVVALVTYVAVVVFYATGPQYFDAAEPTMTAIGWLFHVGEPVYHDVGASERYSHIYGPMAFIIHGAALGTFGAAIQTSKWTGGAMALAALALSFGALQRRVRRDRAVVVTGVCAIVLLAFRNYSFWTRPEPIQLFCVAAALVAAHRSRRTLSVVLAGIVIGVLWNLKITGILYSVPLLAILMHRQGTRAVAATSALAAVCAALPFVVFPNVSLSAYVTWVQLSAQTGLDLAILRQNIEWTAYLSVPLVLAWYSTTRSPDPTADQEWRAVTVALAAAALAVIVAGSKPGAGPYHLMPFVPVVAYLVAPRLPRIEPMADGIDAVPVAAAFLIIGIATSITQQFQFVGTMINRRASDVSAEIVSVADAYPGRVVEMGYALNDPITFQRPLLVFRYNSYLLDQPAVGEHLLAGVAIPPATIAALGECRVGYWLLPKGEPPFAGVNMYPAVRFRPLFPVSFRTAFLEGHRLVRSTDHFDVWQCRGSAAGQR